MKEQTIQVWHNSGEPCAPWHVGLHDGVAIAEQFGTFRNPVEAIKFALDTVAAKVELPVIWPAWLKVVVA